MPRVKTSKTAETEQVLATSPVVDTALVNTSAAVPEKKVKKAKAVKTDAEQQLATTNSVVVAPVVTPVVDEPVVVETLDAEAHVAEQSIEFVAKLQQLNVLISSLKAEYRVLEKKWTRELKIAQKQSSKRKRKAGNRAPSGFVKPTRISDELAMFLEKPANTEMARTEVTRDINKYIRSNNLQDKENGRKINPDAKLAALLKIKKNDELTYFNLQRYMSPHFAKNIVAEKVVA
jgi:upstream activation factor subunit UAF30